jgi:hypothetical protein
LLCSGDKFDPPDQLRILGEAIGAGIVREATRRLEPVQLVRAVFGIDQAHPVVTVDRWMATLGTAIGKAGKS